MKLNWSYKDITHKNQPIFTYNGFFLLIDGKINYYFSSGNKLIEISLDYIGTLLNECEYGFLGSLSLPNRWLHVHQGVENYILFSINAGFDLTRKEFLYNLDPKLNHIYAETYGNEYHLSNDDFIFDEYIISHKGNWGFECRKNGKFVWEFAGKGYLYTEIKRYNNVIVFGTAGRGGHFYGLDLISGDIVFDVDTKGTAKYCYKDGFFYVYRCGKSGRLLKINLWGSIEDDIKL